MLPEELEDLAQEERERQKTFKHHVHVCAAAGCQSRGSLAIIDALKKEAKRRNLQDDCLVKGVGCMGLCAAGPLVMVASENIMYQSVTPGDAPEIIENLGKGAVKRLELPTDIPFFQRQLKIVLENSGLIDPQRIEDYFAAGGYQALAKALMEMEPADVRREIHLSKLRGRGGGGYNTGLKWSTVNKALGQPKYVVCNADEGDPGAFMDRSVLESDPHRVLEGMALAAFAVGASEGFIYVRAEYPLAIERISKAIMQAERAGLLGNRICGTPFSFHLNVRLGAGAFVCGEETALLASIEGRRGNPRPRPPYPAEQGVWRKPTLINNVETFANVPAILRHGGEWFAQIGAENSTGTKVFALAGHVRNTGLIETPMGMSLREIIFDIGGGIPDGRQFKAVQTGGPSGGCIPAEKLDMPVDYESLRAIGSIMGSGGMIVLDSSSCMVDVARFFMEFCRGESCGKCVPCRVGTVHIHETLSRICAGKACHEDIQRMEELCDMVRNTSLCGLGQAAPNPVLSTMRYFADEYIAHVDGKTCPAGVCSIPAEAKEAAS